MMGDDDDDRKEFMEEPYHYKNVLVMKSIGYHIPLLRQLKGSDSNFCYVGSVILESSFLQCDQYRHPSVSTLANLIRSVELLLVLFSSLIEYKHRLSPIRRQYESGDDHPIQESHPHTSQT